MRQAHKICGDEGLDRFQWANQSEHFTAGVAQMCPSLFVAQEDG